MTEGERERPAPVSDEPAPSATKKPHERLPELITLAFQERNVHEQSRYTTEVIDTLIAMRAPGDEAEEARLIVAHLDAKTLHKLVDEKGRRAHQEAVETLLSLGFPHALNISPDDLAEYRANDSLGGDVLARMAARRHGSVVALASHVAMLGAWLALPPTGTLGWLLGSAAAGGAGALMLKASAKNDAIGLPLGLFTVSAGLAFVGAITWPPLIAAAIGMVVAGALARRGKTHEEEAK